MELFKIEWDFPEDGPNGPAFIGSAKECAARLGRAASIKPLGPEDSRFLFLAWDGAYTDSDQCCESLAECWEAAYDHVGPALGEGSCAQFCFERAAARLYLEYLKNAGVWGPAALNSCGCFDGIDDAELAAAGSLERAVGIRAGKVAEVLAQAASDELLGFERDGSCEIGDEQFVSIIARRYREKKEALEKKGDA